MRTAGPARLVRPTPAVGESDGIWHDRRPPMQLSELREAINAAVTRTQAALGETAPTPLGARPEVGATLAVLDVLMERAVRLRDAEERAVLVRELCDVRHRLHEYRALRRLQTFSAMQKGLARLRDLPSEAALLEQAPREIAAALGFDRVLISRVETSQWIPLRLFVRGDAKAGSAILGVVGEEPELLTHQSLESEMVRRRTPLLVLDAQANPGVHRRLAEATGCRSYVAAPIMPEGDVIGLLHADFHRSRRDPDQVDCDALFAFAEAFGALLQAAVYAGRLRAQTRHVREVTAALGSELDALTHTDVRMAAAARTDEGGRDFGRVPVPPRDGPLDRLLTPRELEVMALVATGARNADIAARLVVAEGTVKSHVKQILRKMHANTRAEAVSKYMRLSTLPTAAP